MSKHTPGDWRLLYDAQGPCAIMHPTRTGVALALFTDAFKPENGFHDDVNWPEERNANARLMFAAPKLLKALKSIANAPYRYTSTDDGGTQGWDSPDAAKLRQIAWAAIREAEGEA